MQRLITALRRSLNGETQEKVSNPVISNDIDVKRDALGSMESSEHVDAESEDGFYEIMNNIFPASSPHYISCGNSEESDSSLPQMDALAEPSSHVNTEFFSGSEELFNTSSQPETSSEKTQCSSMKSVAVQCDPITKVTQGVQWEPLLMVSQSVQCEPLLMVSQSVQCEPISRVAEEVQCDSRTQKTQCVQFEPILMVTTGVQYEHPCIVDETGEEHLKYASKQPPENVPYEMSEGVVCETVTPPKKQQCGSDDQQVISILADLSISWPSLQKELDIVHSSQSSVCVSSSSNYSSPQRNSINDVNAPEDELSVNCSRAGVQFDSCSQPVPSTSSVHGKRKKKRTNRVRNMKSSSKSSVDSKKTNCTNVTSERNKESTDGKHSGKRLPLPTRTDRSRSLNEDVNSHDCSMINRNSVQDKEANTVKKVLESISEEIASSSPGKSREKLVDEESPEELLQQMGNNENCSEKEDTCSIKHVSPKRIIKKKTQQISGQQMNNSSCPQNQATSGTAVSLQTQRTDGLHWFSSMACERHSSPESIAEDMFEELREDTSNCANNLALKVQSKDTKLLDESVSFRNVESSTPSKENRSAEKSVVHHFGDDSYRPPSVKRKKFFGADNSEMTSASSKRSAQLVPYSISDSDSESSVPDNFSESNKEMSKKIVNKEQQHWKSVTRNNGIQKRGVLTSELQKQESSMKNNCDKHRKSLSNFQSDSKKNRPGCDVIFSSESDKSGNDDSETSDIEIRIKASRVQNNKMNQWKHGTPSKSGSDSDHRTNVGKNRSVSGRDSMKPRPGRLNIWSSDEGGDDCDEVSCPSTRTYHTRASRRSVRRRAFYTQEEREAILWYIIDHKYYKLVKGKALWERMEKQQVCNDRTWQSMKEHFIKKILPQIETFKLKPEITKRLVSMRK